MVEAGVGTSELLPKHVLFLHVGTRKQHEFLSRLLFHSVLRPTATPILMGVYTSAWGSVTDAIMVTLARALSEWSDQHVSFQYL